MAKDKKLSDIITDIEKGIEERTLLVSELESKLSENIVSIEDELLKDVLKRFVDELIVDDDGRVKNTAKNRKLLREIDKIFADYNTRQTEKIVKTLLASVTSLLAFNQKFYSPLSENTSVTGIDAKAKESLKMWLGISNNDTPIRGAYLDALIKNPTALSGIKNFAFKAITTKTDFQVLKKDFEVLIAGDKNNLGMLQKYYRNFIYDSLSQIDRSISNVYAEGLKFKHAIYAGGLIGTSRTFCREHNQKVFALSEILRFNPSEARPPNYNPLTDLGGYGCRHHLNWIPYAVAKRLRADVPID